MAFEDLYLNPAQVYFNEFDTSFVTGDSPVVHDIKSTLGKRGVYLRLINFGTGDISFEISHDGTNYGDSIYLESGCSKDFIGIVVNKVRATWIADTKYEVFSR